MSEVSKKFNKNATLVSDLWITSWKNIFKKKNEEFWALRNINFEILQGDRIGLVGKNGSGKSTLLKIISNIIRPTTGYVEYYGRLSGLLEVGAGFHGDLSGRENIFLYGSILGMQKKEIKTKLDEIIAFSELEKFIDTPVKHYSSGMYVRLAFSVAAHLDPDILLLDEVLAVGDISFQKKCILKIKDLIKDGNKTILFVSHNMHQVLSLCNKAILLHNGTIEQYDNTEKVVECYLSKFRENSNENNITRPDEITLGYIEKVEVKSQHNENSSHFKINEPFKIVITVSIEKETEGMVVSIGISSETEIPLFTSWTKPLNLQKGKHQVTFYSNDLLLVPGNYLINVALAVGDVALHYLPNIRRIQIEETVLPFQDRIINYKSGFLLNQMEYSINKID
ncbi:MAG: ABC transporter ATP-binding protein [Bacteroidia bacterium]|nr:ABC transporter ATP-binding protein [Bacteroidia bacterium]